MNIAQISKQTFVLVFMVVVVSSCGASMFKEILFLGMANQESPAVSQKFDQMLRTRLSVASGISVTGYEQAMRYRNYIDFSRYPTVATDNLKRLLQILPDSLLLVWGQVQNKSITPVRKTIIGSSLHAHLHINLTIYNPYKNIYLFNGLVRVKKKYPGPLIFFSPPKKVVTIDAVQRNMILDELLSMAADKSSSLLQSLFQTNQQIEEDIQQPENNSNNSPSISDVFTVPSVEGPEITNDKPEIEAKE